MYNAINHFFVTTYDAILQTLQETNMYKYCLLLWRSEMCCVLVRVVRETTEVVNNAALLCQAL